MGWRRSARTLFVLLCSIFLGGLAAGLKAEEVPFRFAVTADSRGNGPDSPVNVPVLQQLFSDMNAFAPAFCLFPGDLTFGGDVESRRFMNQLQVWIDASRLYHGTVYVAPGNHDFRHWAGRGEAWRRMFPAMPHNGPDGVQETGNYYFDYGGSRFISVLSDWEDGHVGVDLKWLNEVLDASSGFNHIFVMSHHPMQQLGGVDGKFWQSLLRHRVDAYFCAHWHLYNRSQPAGAGTWQIVIGTAGAILAPRFPTGILRGTTILRKYGFAIVTVSDSSAEFVFYSNADENEKYTQALDDFRISRPPALSAAAARERRPRPIPRMLGWLVPSRPYVQPLRPIGSLGASAVIAGVPLYLFFFILAYRKASGGQAAVCVGIAALGLAMFCWRMPAGVALSSALYGAALGFFPLGWVLVAAVWLLNMTAESGGFEIMRSSLESISTDRRLQAVFVAIAFSCLLEGSPGFGAPAAVTAGVLVGIGFKPVQAAVVSLLAGSAFVAFGRMGMPIIAAARVSDLDPLFISALIGRELSLIAFLLPSWLSISLSGFRRTLEILPALLAAGLCLALSQAVASHTPYFIVLNAFSAVAAAAGMFLFLRVWKPKRTWRLPADEPQVPDAVASAYTKGQILRAWAPYLILAAMAYLWESEYVKAAVSVIGLKFDWPWLSNLVIRSTAAATLELPRTIEYNVNVGGTGGTAGFLSGLIAVFVIPDFDFRRALHCLGRTLKQLWPALVTISLYNAFAALMIYSGMSTTIASALAGEGAMFPFFSPVIGWFGALLSAGEPRPDALFVPFQKTGAQATGLPPAFAVAAGISGGSCGKMISLQTVCASTGATAAEPHTGRIFRSVLRNSIFMLLILGLFILAQAYLTGCTPVSLAYAKGSLPVAAGSIISR
jgi:lactate permease